MENKQIAIVFLNIAIATYLAIFVLSYVLFYKQNECMLNIRFIKH